MVLWQQGHVKAILNRNNLTPPLLLKGFFWWNLELLRQRGIICISLHYLTTKIRILPVCKIPYNYSKDIHRTEKYHVNIQIS